MVFNGNTVFFISIGVWLIILTTVVARMISHYNRLAHGASKEGLKEVLERLLQTQEKTSIRIGELETSLKNVAIDGTFHIQKVGMVRFNPFSDTGGSQSFTLALLDGVENGLVMTSLYGRTGNRWYIKEVRKGRGKELELSKEEQAAIKRAQTVSGPHHV